MIFKKLLFVVVVSVTFSFQMVSAQTAITEAASPANIKLNRSRGLNMLDDIKVVIKDRYYDKNFHGINLDERFKIAAERIKTVDSNSQIFRIIAGLILEFNDSHTRFYPPNRAYSVEYGFTMQIIGNDCFVTDVKKGSDAEAKGLRAGDRIAGIGNYNIDRRNLWKINYLLYWLSPQEVVKIYAVGADNKEREIEIKSVFKSIKDREKEAEKRRKEKEEAPYKCREISGEAIACRLETFSVEKKYIDKMMAEVGAHKKFILDLRGNGGGYVKIEEYLTGHFFDRDVKIADFITRDKTQERVAKTQKEKIYKGDFIVLIDSDSASASEVFSRVMQIEKRAKIVGDVSAGAVQTSNFVQMLNSRGIEGYETFSFYGMNLTVADLIMSDGKRLENVGVIPDYPVGPSGKALLEKSDPVLAYAARLLGANLTPEDAGKFYFISKKPEEADEEKTDEGDK